MKKLLFAFLMVATFTSCSTWPKFYVGDTSGCLDYDRRNGTVHLEWHGCHVINSAPSDSVEVAK